MNRRRRLTLRPGVSVGLIAAILFGASTPLSKVLLGQVDPVLLAGLLYLSSGSGLALEDVNIHVAGLAALRGRG